MNRYGDKEWWNEKGRRDAKSLDRLWSRSKEGIEVSESERVGEMERAKTGREKKGKDHSNPI